MRQKRNVVQISNSEEKSTPVSKQKVRRIDADARLTEEVEEQQNSVCSAQQ